MTIQELRALYGTAFKCLRDERKMRERVFAQKPATLKRKLREIDVAIAAITAMKDELKRHVEEPPEQVDLLPGHSYPGAAEPPPREY